MVDMMSGRYRPCNFMVTPSVGQYMAHYECELYDALWSWLRHHNLLWKLKLAPSILMLQPRTGKTDRAESNAYCDLLLGGRHKSGQCMKYIINSGRKSHCGTVQRFF